ncbi:MAG: amidohydrolase family protein [Micromonosporaceae bacterium]
MRPPVWDCNRLLGPLGDRTVPSRDVPGLLAELDRLGIDGACVAHTHALGYQPEGGNAVLERAVTSSSRLLPVAALTPDTLDEPDPVGRLRASGVRLARLCPVEHRFRVDGPRARRLLADLADHDVTVLIDFEHTPIEGLERAAAVPGLKLVLLHPGLRRLRDLAEILEASDAVHVETSNLLAHRAAEWIAARFGAHRLLFGTGAPLLDGCGPRFALDHLDLEPADQALVASGNLFRLAGQPPALVPPGIPA